jgi:hypothetical protein
MVEVNGFHKVWEVLSFGLPTLTVHVARMVWMAEVGQAAVAAFWIWLVVVGWASFTQVDQEELEAMVAVQAPEVKVVMAVVLLLVLWSLNLQRHVSLLQVFEPELEEKAVHQVKEVLEEKEVLEDKKQAFHLKTEEVKEVKVGRVKVVQKVHQVQEVHPLARYASLKCSGSSPWHVAPRQVREAGPGQQTQKE